MKEQFLERMHSYLNEEYDAYLRSLNEKPYRGIRINRLKVKEDTMITDAFSLRPSPFCEDGYYVEDTISGNHPYHLAGLFYMQEPSATSVVSVADIQKGDWVLDLCAAPGGKSTQIASRLGQSGFLVSNEIVSNRAQILLSNMERMGVSENMITNTSPAIICKEMQGCFDKVIVDAPCSGEGMFKIHEKAMEDWSEEHVLSCASRQQSILKEAYRALKQNGILVYSTCTYAMEENEKCIYEFLKTHPDMELLDCHVNFGRGGLAYQDLDVSKVRRIFPMDHGEGHFIAKMRRLSDNPAASLKIEKEAKLEDCVLSFLTSQLDKLPANFMVQNNKVYAKNSPFIQLKKTKVLRQGILCGEMVKKRFEPHHHFYMAAALENHRQRWVELDEEECSIYLSGNVLNKQTEKGYIALRFHGHTLGFGKSDGSRIKNKYPKGLRIKSD